MRRCIDSRKLIDLMDQTSNDMGMHASPFTLLLVMEFFKVSCFNQSIKSIIFSSSSHLVNATAEVAALC